MRKFDSPLNNITIASPCSADWNEMFGNDRKRFCGDCKLNVYNLSGMTRDEAEALIVNAEGRLCVRFYQRADGSVITQDCPVGWAKVKQRTSVYAAAVISMVMALFSGVLFASLFQKNRAAIGEIAMPLRTPQPTPARLMGAIAANRPENGYEEIKGDLNQGGLAVPESTPNQGFKIGKMKVMPKQNGIRK